MGRGTSKAGNGRNSGGGGGGNSGEIRGDVSFAEIVNASDNSVSFGRTTTVLPNGYMPVSGKKNEIGALLDRYNITEFVGHMYRDKSGANDLKRMESLGFEIQARYLGQSQGSIPPMDYYYFKKKK